MGVKIEDKTGGKKGLRFPKETFIKGKRTSYRKSSGKSLLDNQYLSKKLWTQISRNKISPKRKRRQ